MKKQIAPKKPLHLAASTVRSLEQRDLAAAAGGASARCIIIVA